MITILLFILGLFIGSFLLVVIDRIPRGETFIKGRSHCDLCGHELAWNDLIPIVSYILLKGKCRYCHKKYGASYPFVEIVTGLIFATIPLFFHFNSIIEYIAIGVILCCCIVIFFSDIYAGIIPDIALIIMSISTLPFLINSIQLFIPHVVVGLCSMCFFLLLFFGTKQKGMGFGDVKLAFVMGFLLGYPLIVMAIYLAFLTGAVVACILIVAKKKKFRKDTISFGPFLILGTYLCLIAGTYLWNIFEHFVFRI